MTTIIIEIGPAREVTYSYTESIRVSLTPNSALQFIGATPDTLTRRGTDWSIRLNELAWYTRGLKIWALANDSVNTILTIHFGFTRLMLAGVIVRLTTPTEVIRPHILNFPPGTLTQRGCRLQINLNTFLREIRQSAEPPQLFQNIPDNINFRTTPLTREEWATSQNTLDRNIVRELDQQVNRQREFDTLNGPLF